MPAGVKTDHDGSCNELLRLEFNKLRAKFDALLAQLDADAGVTDTDYESGLGTGSSAGAADVTVKNAAD